MGGSPAFIGPARFEQFVLPALKELIADLPKPRVLSICGNTNASMSLIAQAGADAVSVDQTNDLAVSRKVLGNGTLLFGNIDPVATLSLGSEFEVRQAVAKSKEAGADAVWPGCDLVLQTSIQNLHAMMNDNESFELDYPGGTGRVCMVQVVVYEPVIQAVQLYKAT